jgi:hypothetical protein
VAELLQCRRLGQGAAARRISPRAAM